MQPTLCSKCKKNIAVVFLSRMEGNEMVNEGLCLRCAREMNLPQVKEMLDRMGVSDEDLDQLSGEMMQAFGGAEDASDLMVDAPETEEDEDG